MPNDLTTAEPIIRPACFPGVLVRLLFPLAAVGMAFLAQSKGWGPFNLVLPPRWAAIPAAVPSAGRQEKLEHDRVGRNVLRLGQPQTIALWPRQVCGSSRAATTFFVGPAGSARRPRLIDQAPHPFTNTASLKTAQFGHIVDTPLPRWPPILFAGGNAMR
ncbi:MAG: hypothetical protein QOD93_6244, partial [Acetobacteraceae bacterium]|nr:hypothetical protein [Acetobacteraceae bacterium]